MTKLDIAKRIVKENYTSAKYGIYDCYNVVGDEMTVLYYKDGLEILICYPWMYFEVIGLSDDEFYELTKYYRELAQIPKYLEKEIIPNKV